MRTSISLPLALCCVVVLGCSGPGSAKKAESKKPSGLDAKALSVLEACREAMYGLKSYTAECLTTIAYDSEGLVTPPTKYSFAILRAQKPNHMRYDAWDLKNSADSRPNTTPTYTFTCDGKAQYQQFGTQYRKAPSTEPESLHTILEPWEGFFSLDSSLYASVTGRRAQGETADLAYGGQESVESELCDVVRVHTVSEFAGTEQDDHAVVYISVKDRLVRRAVDHILFDGKRGYTRTSTIRNIVVDGPISPGVFAYSPPKGVELEKPQVQRALLPKGRPAPVFTAQDLKGSAVKLEDFKGKVVMVDFWASWCAPCVMSMAHTQEVVKKLQDEGLPVVALAVDDGEDRDHFAGWVSENQSKYPNIRYVYVDPQVGLANQKYMVTGIPTQYILDAKGVIQASFVGYGGPTDDLEKALRAAAK